MGRIGLIVQCSEEHVIKSQKTVVVVLYWQADESMNVANYRMRSKESREQCERLNIDI